jgi:hypothetical protein
MPLLVFNNNGKESVYSEDGNGMKTERKRYVQYVYVRILCVCVCENMTAARTELPINREIY